MAAFCGARSVPPHDLRTCFVHKILVILMGFPR